MDDQQFDQLMARANPRTPQAAGTTASLLAAEITGTGRQARRHRPLIVAAAVGGTIALAGAGTLTAYQLGIPPFQTTDPGSVRIEPGVPVDYTNSLGNHVHCLAFMEFEHITPDQKKDLESIAASPSWDSYGDRALAELDMPDASPSAQNQALLEAVTQDLLDKARQVVPDVGTMRSSDGPVYHGTAMSCTGPGGVDGTR